MGDKRSSLAFQALLMTIMYTLASVGAGEALEHHRIATVLSGHLPRADWWLVCCWLAFGYRRVQ